MLIRYNEVIRSRIIPIAPLSFHAKMGPDDVHPADEGRWRYPGSAKPDTGAVKSAFPRQADTGVGRANRGQSGQPEDARATQNL